jgi:succinate-acetate transporter protein
MSNTLAKIANPAPLGLLGFGLTTVLLNLANAGAIPLNSVILAMGIAYGGIAQIIVGAMEYKNGNTFGTVAFTSYGLFWWSLVIIFVMPQFSIFSAWAPTASSLAAYFIMWGIFTFAMFFGTLRANRALQVVFATLTILFFMLAIAQYAGSTLFTHITGIEGIICGSSAIYLAVAEILNESHQKTILPIGKV